MDIKIAGEALQKIAKKEGISVEVVRSEIEFALAEAHKNPNPEIQAFWKAIPRKGDYPSPEEVIIHIAEKIQ